MADLKNKYLQDLSVQIEQHIGEARSLFSSLNSLQINWKPDEKHWSIAQCFDHIIVSDQQYFNGIKKAIELTHGSGLSEKKPYRPGFFARWFIHSMKPGSWVKSKAPTIFQPSARTEGKKILDDFVRHEQELLVLIKKCDGWDLNTIKIPSPVNAFFKFSLGECFSILVNHQRRHFQQAQRLGKLPAFPKKN